MKKILLALSLFVVAARAQTQTNIITVNQNYQLAWDPLTNNVAGYRASVTPFNQTNELGARDVGMALSVPISKIAPGLMDGLYVFRVQAYSPAGVYGPAGQSTNSILTMPSIVLRVRLEVIATP